MYIYVYINKMCKNYYNVLCVYPIYVKNTLYTCVCVCDCVCLLVCLHAALFFWRWRCFPIPFFWGGGGENFYKKKVAVFFLSSLDFLINQFSLVVFFAKKMGTPTLQNWNTKNMN